jgi:hypothetical protein
MKGVGVGAYTQTGVQHALSRLTNDGRMTIHAGGHVLDQALLHVCEYESLLFRLD